MFVVPGFADWEPAHAVAELRRYGGYRTVLVGLSTAPVESMGGITVTPNVTTADVHPKDVAVFILPGGDRWEQAPPEPELVALLHRLDQAGVPLAAICGATLAIAHAGLLRDRKHTSNGRDYLHTHVPGYTGSAQYVTAPAVRDAGLITASGLGDVEFAYEIMTELSVLSASDRAEWLALFRNGQLPPERPN